MPKFGGVVVECANGSIFNISLFFERLLDKTPSLKWVCFVADTFVRGVEVASTDLSHLAAELLLVDSDAKESRNH